MFVSVSMCMSECNDVDGNGDVDGKDDNDNDKRCSGGNGEAKR